MAEYNALTSLDRKSRFAKEHPFQNLLNIIAMVNQQTANPQTNTRAAQILGGIGRGWGTVQQAGMKNAFLQGVQQITQSDKTPDEKINDLIGLMTQHGTDYGLGLKDVIEQYGKQSERGFKITKDTATQKRQDLIDSTKIREEFLNRPEIKEYVTISTQVKSMDSLLKKAEEGNIQNKTALDQALITMFNELIDPNSVVRESEYARTPENLPLANRFSGALQKLQKGGAGLTNSDREALVWGAKVIANERGNTFNTTLQSYIDLANQYGIEPSLISRGMKPHTEYKFNNQKNLQNRQIIRTGIYKEKKVAQYSDGSIQYME